MEILEQVFMPLLPWALFGAFVYGLSKMTALARRASKVAIAVGVLTQMFIPDPKVEQTIQMVVKQKQQAEDQQAEQEGEGELYKGKDAEAT